MSPDSDDLMNSLAEMAATINSTRSLDEVLEALAHAAQTSLSCIDDVGVSIVHSDGTIETKASTGKLVLELDELQASLNEGPCISAIHEGGVVVTEDITSDPRWPSYGPAAREVGLRAQMGIQLWADAKTIGGLNLYSLARDTIDEDCIMGAQLFANQAALALGRSRMQTELHEGMEKRGLIGTALGILMERHRIDQHQAFQYLTRVSQHSNTKIRAIAEEVVDGAVAGYRANS